jgi:hypothetical protein
MLLYCRGTSVFLNKNRVNDKIIKYTGDAIIITHRISYPNPKILLGLINEYA